MQRVFLSSCVSATLSVVLLSPVASGQTNVPRTADGRPDLNGVWGNNSATPLERPDELGDKAAFTEDGFESALSDFVARTVK